MQFKYFLLLWTFLLEEKPEPRSSPSSLFQNNFSTEPHTAKFNARPLRNTIKISALSIENIFQLGSSQTSITQRCYPRPLSSSSPHSSHGTRNSLAFYYVRVIVSRCSRAQVPCCVSASWKSDKRCIRGRGNPRDCLSGVAKKSRRRQVTSRPRRSGLSYAAMRWSIIRLCRVRRSEHACSACGTRGRSSYVASLIKFQCCCVCRPDVCGTVLVLSFHGNGELSTFNRCDELSLMGLRDHRGAKDAPSRRNFAVDVPLARKLGEPAVASYKHHNYDNDYRARRCMPLHESDVHNDV